MNPLPFSLPGLSVFKLRISSTSLYSALTTVLLFSMMPLTDQWTLNPSEMEVRPVKKHESEKPPPLQPPKSKPRPDETCLMTKLHTSASQKTQKIPFTLESRLEKSLSSLAVTVEKGSFDLKFSPAFKAELSSFAFKIQEVDTPPSPLFKIKPHYPLKAKHQKTEGALLMQFTVNPKGETQDIQIMEADPPGLFNASASEAIRQWKFNPGYKDGKPVSVRVSLPLKYHLEE